MRASQSPLPLFVFLAIVTLRGAAPQAPTGALLQAEAEAVRTAPDVRLSLVYPLPSGPEKVSALVRRPLLFLHLWEVYGFAPRYIARAGEGASFHLVDPTGIEGDVFPAGGAEDARLYLAKGAIKHRLAPPFRGSALLDLSYVPEGEGSILRVGLSIRMENRLVGFFVWTFFPLVRSLVVHRIDSNIADIETIMADLETKPEATAGRLDADEAASLLAELGKRPGRSH